MIKDKKELKLRLSTLYKDVNLKNSQASDMLSLIGETSCDREELFNNIYFKENSPLKTMNYYFKPVVKGDVTQEMIRISCNYDVFLREMFHDAKKIIDEHSVAVDLFLILLSLPRPYSQILYFRHYKGFSREEVMTRMFLSRSSYYRIYEEALNMTMDTLNERVNK